MITAVESLDTTEAICPVAFGSLLDLARLRIPGASAETCDACNTINPVHALACKCCAHKLPAFHATMPNGPGGRARNAVRLCRHALVEMGREWTTTLCAALSPMARSPWIAAPAHRELAGGSIATGQTK